MREIFQTTELEGLDIDVAVSPVSGSSSTGTSEKRKLNDENELNRELKKPSLAIAITINEEKTKAQVAAEKVAIFSQLALIRFFSRSKRGTIVQPALFYVRFEISQRPRRTFEPICKLQRCSVSVYNNRATNEESVAGRRGGRVQGDVHVRVCRKFIFYAFESRANHLVADGTRAPPKPPSRRIKAKSYGGASFKFHSSDRKTPDAKVPANHRTICQATRSQRNPF
ncbi:hypothetical protein V9T40_011769 [Parthenolecanium corni]|uniref:Uncharacterized protein n=1 Tax=Parthenolecanium corni TaxID=536013 RepID=A0AAN9T9X9_9HEMI